MWGKYHVHSMMYSNSLSLSLSESTRNSHICTTSPQTKGRFIVNWEERVRYMVPEGLVLGTDLKPYVDPSTPKVTF